MGRRPSFFFVLDAVHPLMEITSFGETCLRFRAEGIVVADPFPRSSGPTGRGLTADIVTYSHAEDQPACGWTATAVIRTGAATASGPDQPRPAFLLDSPGEYEVHEILITGVRTYRDEQKGAQRGRNIAFVYELDGLHAVHLGDIGHLLTEDVVDKIGTVEVACVPIGGSLAAARAAELVAQLDAKLVVPMPLEAEGVAAEMERFLHEMSVQQPEPAPKLTVTISSLPPETTVVLLEPRGRT